MIGRITKFIESTGLSEQKFAEYMGIKQQTLNNYTRGINKFPLSFIERIVETYPDLSAEWLLRGEGDMYRTSNMDYEKSESYNEELLKNFVDQTSTLLSNRDERIRELEIENAALKSGISVKNVG